MRKLWTMSGRPNALIFHCPGCRYGHLLTVNGEKNESGATWAWNGSMELPTFSPSYLVTEGLHRCHSFIRDGMIQYLPDCSHDFAGQTIDIPDVEES